MDGTYVSSDGIFTLIISGASCTFITFVSGRSVTQNGTIDKYYRTITIEYSGPKTYTFDGNTINLDGLKLIKQ